MKQYVTQEVQTVFDPDEEHEIFIPFEGESANDLEDELMAEGCEFIIEHLPGLELVAHVIHLLDMTGMAHDIDQRPVYRHEFVQAMMRFKQNPYYVPGNRQGVWVRFTTKPAPRQVSRAKVVNVGSSISSRSACAQLATTNAPKPAPVIRSPWTITPPTLHPSWMRGRGR